MAQITLDDLRKEAIKPRRKKFSTVDWLMMSEDEVLTHFASLPGAIREGKGDEQFVYVPGTRPDKVLLVAHSDVVPKFPRKIGFARGFYFSTDTNNGIGADDRAGCNILWKLRNMGHSLLIPNAEESGCKGSRFLTKSKDWIDEISKHQFAIQFDRRQSKDLVSYSVGSSDFTKYLESKMPGYKGCSGSHTDICVLCDAWKHEKNMAPCAVNISIGYYHEHTSNECLNIRQWNSTLSYVYELLKPKDLPAFKQKSYTTYNRHNEYSTNCGYYGYHHVESASPASTSTSRAISKVASTHSAQETSIASIIDEIMICPDCDGVADISEVKANNSKCLYCNKEIPL